MDVGIWTSVTCPCLCCPRPPCCWCWPCCSLLLAEDDTNPPGPLSPPALPPPRCRFDLLFPSFPPSACLFFWSPPPPPPRVLFIDPCKAFCMRRADASPFLPDRKPPSSLSILASEEEDFFRLITRLDVSSSAVSGLLLTNVFSLSPRLYSIKALNYAADQPKK